MRNLHFPVLQLHGILYIIGRRGIHLIFAKNKRIFFLNCFYRYWYVLVKMTHMNKPCGITQQHFITFFITL